MSPERWERVTELFSQALELPRSERSSFVQTMCGSDADLRAQVVDMLQNHERAGSFLETEAIKLPPLERRRAFNPGDVVSERYRVVRLLGQGGMGDVYEVEDLELGGSLALKTVRPDIAASEGSLARFRQEIHLSRKINHPNVCRVYDIARHVTGDQSVVYFTMELLTGQTLAERIRASGPMTPKQALPLICQMAHALSAAHQANIIHRDFKPSNVILLQDDPEREAVVTDFGLARLSTQARDGSITETGLVVGTPAYMAPEQLIGEPLSPETDIYALGLVIYEMLTGRLPFQDDSVSNSELRRLRDEPEPPSLYAPGLDPRWEAAVLQCLEREPARRFHSALLLAGVLTATRERSTAALTEAVTPSPRKRGKFALALVSLCSLAAVITGAIWWSNRPPATPPEAKHWLDIGTNAIRDGVYWKATKALQRAIAIDPAMPLAHARLAEAWTELQDPNKAKEEFLKAGASDLDGTHLRGIDKLQFEAIYLTLTRDFPGAVRKYEQLLDAVPASEKHYAYVDLGEAYERNAQWKKAMEAYTQATTLDRTSPAGFLRLGMLYRTRSELKEAQAKLTTAGSLYKDQSDPEGETEVEYQLARVSAKPALARPLLQSALTRAKDRGNIYQEVRILLQLGVEAIADGQLEEAKRDATDAMNIANENQVGVLAVNGLIDVGNTLFLSRAYTKAEEYFQDALRTAALYHADRQENAALLDLGSLYITINRPDEGLKNVLAAKQFFDTNGFRVESSRASVLIGRFKRDHEDFAGALKAFQEQLSVAMATEDSGRIADALEEIAAVYYAQENYPAAVKSYERALSIRKELGAKMNLAYTEVSLAVSFEALGRLDKTNELIKQEGASGTGIFAPLDRAAMMLIEGNYPGALAICEKLASSPAHDDDEEITTNRIMGLCRLKMGSAVKGLRLCQQALALAQERVPGDVPDAQLALMQAQLESGDAKAALRNANELIARFEKTGQLSSLWRSLLYAALAANAMGDLAGARQLIARARATLEQIRNAFGAEDYKSYVSRADISSDLRELDKLKSIQ